MLLAWTQNTVLEKMQHKLMHTSMHCSMHTTADSLQNMPVAVFDQYLRSMIDRKVHTKYNCQILHFRTEF